MNEFKAGDVVYVQRCGYILITGFHPEGLWNENPTYEGKVIDFLHEIPREDRERGIPWIRLIYDSDWTDRDPYHFELENDLVIIPENFYILKEMLGFTTYAGHVSMTSVGKKVSEVDLNYLEQTFEASPEYEMYMRYSREARLAGYHSYFAS
jgi:hypothetical protein